jgi:hypothetical protein
MTDHGRGRVLVRGEVKRVKGVNMADVLYICVLR